MCADSNLIYLNWKLILSICIRCVLLCHFHPFPSATIQVTHKPAHTEAPYIQSQTHIKILTRISVISYSQRFCLFRWLDAAVTSCHLVFACVYSDLPAIRFCQNAISTPLYTNKQIFCAKASEMPTQAATTSAVTHAFASNIFNFAQTHIYI